MATVTHVDGDVASLRGAVVSSASRAACHDWGLEAGDLRHRLGKLALLYRYGVDVVARKPGRQLRYLRAESLRVPHQDGEETSSGSVPSVSAVAGSAAVPGSRLASSRLPAAVGHGGGRRPVANHLADPAARATRWTGPAGGHTLPRRRSVEIGAEESRHSDVAAAAGAAARRPLGEGTMKAVLYRQNRSPTQ